MSSMSPRSTPDGRQALRLEAVFWDAIAQMAQQQNQHLYQLSDIRALQGRVPGPILIMTLFMFFYPTVFILMQVIISWLLRTSELI